MALADQIALLLDGRIVQHDHPEAFYRRPASEAVARFFGGVNFIPGTARDGLFLSALGPLTLPSGAVAGDRILTLRPEALRLSPEDQGRDNSRAARVTAVTFLGTQTRVALDIECIALQALIPPDAGRALTPGDRITVALPPEALWLLPPR